MRFLTPFAVALVAAATFPAVAQDKVQVRLDWVNSGYHALWYLAKDRGVFAKHKLDLEVLGLGEATTEKLISAGIETVQELAAAPLEKLVEIPGIGEKTAEKVLATATSMCGTE